MAGERDESDVDDVLSSVRRLIAGDSRRTRGDFSEPTRLVLSPSLRVTEDAKSAPSDTDTPLDLGAPKGAPESGSTLEDRIADLEAAVSRRPEAWEPDGSEDQAQHRPERMTINRNAPVSAPSPLRLSRISLVHPAPVDDAEEEAEPSAFADDPMPDAPGTSDAIEDAVVVDEIPPSLMAEDSTTTTSKDDSGAPQEAFGMDLAVEDEEELRQLVSALIRDELQGELGERITRNVRKLVRREIQRALAARDLS